MRVVMIALALVCVSMSLSAQQPAASGGAPALKLFASSADVAALMAKAACASCHGANLSKTIAPNYPKIAGQYSDYLFVALKAYKTEGNPSVGRNNGVMGPIAKQFSNAELKALAQYVGSLDGEVETKTESRFHH